MTTTRPQRRADSDLRTAVTDELHRTAELDAAHVGVAVDGGAVIPDDATQDADIAREAGEALRRAVDVPATVPALVHDHVITLTGSATWQHQREAAERTVRHLRGVTGLRDEIALRPPVAADDVHIEITEALVRLAQLDAAGIDVLAGPGGTVTLRGTVHSWAERRQADHAAWSASGVVTVVNELRVES